MAGQNGWPPARASHGPAGAGPVQKLMLQAEAAGKSGWPKLLAGWPKLFRAGAGPVRPRPSGQVGFRIVIRTMTIRRVRWAG